MNARDSLTVAVGITALVTFGITVSPLALPIMGVLGVAFIIAFPVFTIWRWRKRGFQWIDGVFAVMTPIYCGWFVIREWPPDLHKFGEWQAIGVFGLFTAGWLLLYVAYRKYRRTRKACPDCLGDMPKDARVCRACRWQDPRIPRVDTSRLPDLPTELTWAEAIGGTGPPE
jgi:hypothetical protein